MWNTLKTRVLGAVIPCTMAVLGGLVVLLWMRFVPATKPVYDPTPQPVQTAQEVKTVTKFVTRTIVKPGPERIVYLDRQEAAVALKMPELATGQDNILAAVTIPPHSGNTTAISTLTPTGEGHILIRKETPKFFQLKREFLLTGRYLFTGANLAELEVVASPLRIGPVELQAGVGVEVRRDDNDLGARSWVGASYWF